MIARNKCIFRKRCMFGQPISARGEDAGCALPANAPRSRDWGPASSSFSGLLSARGQRVLESAIKILIGIKHERRRLQSAGTAPVLKICGGHLDTGSGSRSRVRSWWREMFSSQNRAGRLVDQITGCRRVRFSKNLLDQGSVGSPHPAWPRRDGGISFTKCA